MSVLVLLIFASLAVATVFLVGFIWAIRSGQYEDTCTPSMRMLTEDAGRTGAVQTISVSDQNPERPQSARHSTTLPHHESTHP